MSDLLIQEIEDELRQDRYKALWKKYGTLITAITILFVGSIAGWRGYSAWQQSKAAQESAKLISILNAEQAPSTETSQKLNELISSTGSGVKTLARFRLAAEKIRANDFGGAVAAYDELANDQSLSTALNDFARLRAAYLLLDHASSAEAVLRVERLNNETNPLRHSAREILGLAAYKAKDLAKAVTYFDEVVNDPECPNDLRNRVQVMLSLLAADGMTSEKAQANKTPEKPKE